jgi:hypothetical protein
MGLTPSRTQKLLRPFIEKQEKVVTLIQHSFFAEASKRGYGQAYRTRRNHLERE